MAVCSIPKRSHSASVWAKSRAVTRTSAPRARRTSITGRMTSTWGEFVRSTQTRTQVECSSRSLAWLTVSVSAAVTDQLVDFAVNVIKDLGLPGIFLLMVAESACIPIPSEATLLFAGFNVYNGEYPLWAVVAVGTAANVVGSWIAYAIGYYRPPGILERHGRQLHVKPSPLQWAARWFERYGSATVFFPRLLPVIRTFISLPAGVARMPFWRFTLLTFAG